MREKSHKSLFPQKCGQRICMINSISSYIIGPKGEIYKCWNDVGHVHRTIGSIFESEPNEKTLLYRYMFESDMFSDEKCKDCHVFPLCSGGCGHYRYRNKYQGGEFELCSRYKNKEILADTLIKSISKKS